MTYNSSSAVATAVVMILRLVGIIVSVGSLFTSFSFFCFTLQKNFCEYPGIGIGGLMSFCLGAVKKFEQCYMSPP